VSAMERETPPWAAYRDILSPEDVERVSAAGFAQRVGPGLWPALLLIDVQEYMVHVPGGPGTAFPSSCGAVARSALAHIETLLVEARQATIPIVYTRFELRADGRDAGVYGLKRAILQSDGWCLEGSGGAAIAAEVRPDARDHVIVKKKPSAFWGTPLLGLLLNERVDTLIVVGGSTSNCVRATVVDGASYNFHVLIPHEGVFDRFDISHRAAIFDMDRQYGDVTTTRAVVRYLRGLRQDT
jgi:maleamate amidohydrolase